MLNEGTDFALPIAMAILCLERRALRLPAVTSPRIGDPQR
jgi:hypothetical protein